MSDTPRRDGVDVVESPDSHEPTSGDVDLATETVRGVGWTAGAQIGRQVVQTGLSIVVARLLVPADFGQMSQVLVLTGLANLLADFGLGAALVQRRDLSERHRSSVFWLQAMLGVIVAAIVAGSAPLIARFYDDPDLVAVTLAISPYFFLSSLCTVQRALLMRAMRFRANAAIELSALGLGGVVCVIAAQLDAGVMSIVLQQLTFVAVTVAGLWTAAHWRPKMLFDRAAIRDLLPFSRNLLGFNVINYAIRNGDNLLVGRLMGATALGLYTRGYSILLYPSRQITAVVGKVMFASLSRVNDDVERLRRGYLRAVSVIALLTFPLMAGVALVADDLVPVLLGSKWNGAIDIIRIFALLGITESIASSVGWIYQSTGRTDVLLKWALYTGGVPLAGIAIGSLGDTVESVTIGYAVSTTLLVYPCFRVAGALIDLPVRDVARSVSGVAVCVVGMALVVGVVHLALPADASHVLSLAAKSLAGAVAYAALVHVIHVEAYRDLRARVADIRRSK